MITFTVNGGESLAEEYEKAPTVDVRVGDDEEHVISAGLASVKYQIGDGIEHSLQEDFAASMRNEIEFTIPEGMLPVGGADIIVRAEDNAGNHSENKITVNIHAHRGSLVEAVNPTCLTAGNKAYYVCACGRRYADSSCMREITLQDVTLPAKGHDYSGAYAYDADGHWKVCSRCGVVKEKHSHIYDNDKDAICNVCGFERTIQKPEPEKPGGGGGTETPTPPAPPVQPEKPEEKPESKPTEKPESKPESKPTEKPESKPESKPTEKPESKPENKPESKPESKPTEKPESKPTEKPESKPTEKPENKPTEKPESKPENQPTDRPENKPTDKPEEKSADRSDTSTVRPDISDASNESANRPDIPVVIDNGKVITSGETVATGNVRGMADTSTALNLGDGKVIVTVVCEEKEYTAGVADTSAVANAVLTTEQVKSVADGENIEIRVEVKDLSGNVPKKDKTAIESGMEEYRKELSDLTLGKYVDISLFVKTGKNNWSAVTGTTEPIEVVIGIPSELQSDDREFFIIRSHEGEYALLKDMDDAPDTITIHTDRFSAYAIAYEHVSRTAENEPCGLCHICPTFFGICYFIWLMIIMVVLLIIWIFIRRNRNKKEK